MLGSINVVIRSNGSGDSLRSYCPWNSEKWPFSLFLADILLTMIAREKLSDTKVISSLSSINIVIQSKGSTNSLRSKEIQGFWLVEISQNVNFVRFWWKLICRSFMGLRTKANSFHQNSRLLIGRNVNFVWFWWKLVCMCFMGLQMEANCFRHNSRLLIGQNVNSVQFWWKLVCRGFMGLQMKTNCFPQNSRLLIGWNVNFVRFA